jgi:hypothetical protein
VDVATTLDNATMSETLHSKEEVLQLAEHLSGVVSELISYGMRMEES